MFGPFLPYVSIENSKRAFVTRFVPGLDQSSSQLVSAIFRNAAVVASSVFLSLLIVESLGVVVFHPSRRCRRAILFVRHILSLIVA